MSKHRIIKEANQPTLNNGVLAVDPTASTKFTGLIDASIRSIEAVQLLSPGHWTRFVRQFREQTDTDRGWRGEYWGKLMRGACFVYRYTKNPELYEILTATVRDLLSSFDADGRLSSYPVEDELHGWDIWCRKYALLGMQYYLEICEDDELIDLVIDAMIRQVDTLMSLVGPEEGKIDITDASDNWLGLNSSSILEPIVRLYNITGEVRFLDYASYIVENGGISVANLFDLAYENDFHPYQYPTTKAYEMISCFEGLMEYYRVTGEERYRVAIVNFSNSILATDFTVIGSSGCTHELFDYSTARQANTTNDRTIQETCVTVTLMKFFYQLTLLTGDPKYVDAFERSLYNAYLGSINSEAVIEPSMETEFPHLHLEALPFDSYSPLTAGVRGSKIGGFKIMPDDYYYGCCACIGAAGIGLVPKMAIMKQASGLRINLYSRGRYRTTTPAGEAVSLVLETDYPVDGQVQIRVELEHDECFTISCHKPGWSRESRAWVNGQAVDAVGAGGDEQEAGLIVMDRCWKPGDRIEIELDMRTEAIYPTPYGSAILMNHVIWDKNFTIPSFDCEDPLAKYHVALRRGALMLALDDRLGVEADAVVPIRIDADDTVETVVVNTGVMEKDGQGGERGEMPFNTIISVDVPLTDGRYVRMTDYASAGKLWTEESRMAVWIERARSD